MLETTVGAPLFDRLPRGMGLTAAGSILLPQAKLILRDSQRFTDTIEQLKMSRRSSRERWS
jgi:DNA-binding transcriptional LysR family regulator